MRYNLFILFTSVISLAAFAQNDAYKKHLYIEGGDTMPYRLLLPKNYDASKSYPLILFLHGSGERGNNNEAQLVHGSSLFLKDSIRKKYSAIVVFPQCDANGRWSSLDIKVKSENTKNILYSPQTNEPTRAMKLLLGLIKSLEKNYKINSKRRYVGGLSLGGMGTFELVSRMPNYFAAAFPICGGSDPQEAKKMINTRWWIFHGAKDNVVLPDASRIMVTALKKAGAKVKFTLYPNANHNSWDPAFAEKDLLPWLFSNKK